MRTGNFQMSTLRVIRGTLHENVPYMFHMWNKNAFTSELLKHWNSPWRLFFARKPIPSGWNTRAEWLIDEACWQFVNHSTNVQKLFLEKRVRGESWNSLEKFLNQLTLTFVPLERIFRGTTKVASVTDTRPEADVTRSWIVRKENIGISLVESSIMEHLSNHLRCVERENRNIPASKRFDSLTRLSFAPRFFIQSKFFSSSKRKTSRSLCIFCIRIY